MWGGRVKEHFPETCCAHIRLHSYLSTSRLCVCVCVCVCARAGLCEFVRECVSVHMCMCLLRQRGGVRDRETDR